MSELPKTPSLAGARVLAVHAGAELYGADRMFVRCVQAMNEAGAGVTVVVPGVGPLLSELSDIEVDATVRPTLVLRKSLLAPKALPKLLVSLPVDVFRCVRAIRASKTDVVYVNTVTLPTWIIAARILRKAVVCHVREAEDQMPKIVQQGLAAPLRLATKLIANSAATKAWLTSLGASLGRRTQVVFNGFDFPVEPTESAIDRSGVTNVALVGRLSPRKGQDVALEAVAALVVDGYDVHLDLVGSVFPGYEWFESDLHARAVTAGVADRVSFSGFERWPWDAYARSQIVVVPSRTEPFGNVAVEAMCIGRPTIVSAVGGLQEIVTDGVNGLTVPADDASALAAAIKRLFDDPDFAHDIAKRAADDVRQRFSFQTMKEHLTELMAEVRPEGARSRKY